MNIFFDYFSMNVLPKSLESDNNFISDKIKKYISNNLKKFRRITFVDGENLIEIQKNGEKAIRELEEARDIYHEVRTLAKRANTLTQKPIRIHIFLVDIAKELDLTKDNITSTECNSGSTTFYDDYLEIAIWRSEEWQKVLYHELIHACYLDKVLIREDYLKEIRLKQLFPHYNNSIFEAYSEILATILWIKNKEGLDFDIPATRGLEKMKDQNIFLGAQVNKIIYFMSQKFYSSSSSFAKPINNFFRNPKKLLDDGTNTSSYYILKSIYLWNAIYKDKTLLNVEKLIDKEFIQNHFYDIFINSLESNEYLEWLNKIFFIPKNTSLRLTL